MKYIPFIFWLLYLLTIFLFVGQTTIILTTNETTFKMERPILFIITIILSIIVVFCELKINKK